MDTSRIARTFPLVARPRPACLPLAERVREVQALARDAAGGDLAKAAAAQNRAALIASDCGLPHVARSLCWDQADVCLRARPLGAQAARNALEPLVNLARLLIRDGDGEGAWRLLDNLYRSVRDRTGTVLDGRTVSFADLTDSDDAHATVHRWLWTVVLADGTRALTTAGRWSDALRHAEEHDGVGNRLLDGRQVAVLAAWSAGKPREALDLLVASGCPEPWEEAVGACLRVLCGARASASAADGVATMVHRYLGQRPKPGLAVFHTRLGLAVLDLAEHPADRSTVHAHLVAGALNGGDGYAAREVLAHPLGSDSLTGEQTRELRDALALSGLDTGRTPTDLLPDLLAAAETGRAVAAATLTATTAPQPTAPTCSAHSSCAQPQAGPPMPPSPT